MKTIKTRSRVKGIKVLDKSVSLSKRMKNAVVRTKERAGETQNSRHASPTDYASDNIQGAAQDRAREIVRNPINLRQKARENWSRAKNHFQDVKRQLPKERKRAAEQAQKAAQKTKSNAKTLKNTADQARTTANEAKTAVGDAKLTLREVRQSGRRTLREVKQDAKSGSRPRPKNIRSNGKTPDKPTITKSCPKRPVNSSGGSRPGYMNRRASHAKNTAEKSVKTDKSTVKNVKKTAKGTVKTAKKSVKTAEKTAKSAVKTAQRTAKAAQKSAQAAAKAAKIAERAARAAAKAAIQTAKAATKAIIALVKAAIAAIKGLVAAIAAGGWVAVLVILIICLIGLLVGSVFGIFFSSEPSGDDGKTINGVIAEINDEYTAQIDAIISGNSHDLLDMSGARASWKQVLAVYTVKTVSDPDSPMEVATIDDEKATILRNVFWEMNTITNTTDSVEVEEDVLDEDGLPTGETETVTRTVLWVIVTHKSPEEMATQYGFTAEQKEWLEELLKAEYNSLWNALLYGISSMDDGSLIEIADTQIGNIGGEPYWRWYGFPSRVEWCACFVSWCAEQCGFIDAGIIPKFSSCENGIQWFKAREQWRDNTYISAPGDIIFFDWEPDGTCDHVGIVENVADGKVNTIEGNSSDSVARRGYQIDSEKIMGFGVPIY